MIDIIIISLKVYFGLFVIGGAIFGAISGLISATGLLIEVPVLLGHAIRYCWRKFRNKESLKKALKNNGVATSIDTADRHQAK